MSTKVTVNTYTHTVTYVTSKLLYSLQTIIREIGLDPAKLTKDWSTLEEGISTWLEARDLIEIVLEVFDERSGKLATRWDLEIVYGYTGDGSLWTDTWAIKYAIEKAGFSPKGCDYRIIVRTKPGARSLSGWSSTEFKSTAGFNRYSLGSTIGGNGLASEASYWSK